MVKHYQRALNRIQAIVDAYKDDRIHITAGNDEFNIRTHTYDVSTVMGIIDNQIAHAYRCIEYESRMHS